MKPLNKTLFLLMLPLTLLVADSPISTTQLDFSSLVNDFMEEGNVLKKTINLSGKQRMLTQLMAKLALQVDVNIKKDESLKRLKKISDLYDNMLKAFKEGNSDLGIKKTTNAKVIKQIRLVEKAWNPFYKEVNQLIEGKNSKEALTYIVEKNEDLLKVSNDLVKVFESTNSSENYLEKARLHIVNVAGRQRMLTQKMTKEKLLILKGEKKYDSKLKETVALFDDSLTALIKGDSKKMISKPSNEKIIAQLKVVSKLWSELKPLYEKKKNSAKELATIVTKNPLLLKEMNSMVKMAEKEVEY
jgi:hypothetical protein